MSFNILYTEEFERQVKPLIKKYPSLKQDLTEFVKELSENPVMGDHLGGNTYKVRMAIASKGKGKSGGARIITYVVTSDNEVYLLTIYDKTDIGSVSKTYIQSLINDLNPVNEKDKGAPKERQKRPKGKRK
jgi:mRNA-degrading endonuclease RelE of RelBE toxin-antitoxin system